MVRTRIVVLACIGLCGTESNATTAALGKGTTAFVSTCQTDASDATFGEGVRFAFVHEVGQNSTILYRISHSGFEPVAELHHATAGNSMFVEAQGGVQSTAIASDVVAFFRRQSFVLLEDWQASTLEESKFVPCK